MSDPSAVQADEEVLRLRLAARPDEVIRLRQALADLEGFEGPLVSWRGGQPGADGVVQMPFPEYHPAVAGLLSALSAVHAVPAFDWMSWAGDRRYPTAREVADAPLADVLRLLTTWVRGERFSDGVLAGVLADGRLPAAARRVVEGR